MNICRNICIKEKPNTLVNVQEFNYIEVDVLIQHTRMQMYIDYRHRNEITKCVQPRTISITVKCVLCA